MNVISEAASKNYLIYPNDSNEIKKMPAEEIMHDFVKLETEYNFKYNSFKTDDYVRIKMDEVSLQNENMYEMMHENEVAVGDPLGGAGNSETELNPNLKTEGVTLQKDNAAEAEQIIDCVVENNYVSIKNSPLPSAVATEDSTFTAAIDVSNDDDDDEVETIPNTIACNVTPHAGAPQKRVISVEARPQYECDVCGKRFIKFRNYNNHLKSHNLESMHKCVKCDMIYLRTASLERHMEQFHTSTTTDEVDNRRCRFCKKFYRSKYALKIHMRFHTGDLPCLCPTCGKRFSDNGHLGQHIRVKHQQFRFKCIHENCGKLFETDRALRNHGYEHDKSWPFVCAHCGKGMGTKYSCRTHIAKRHKIYATDAELNAMQQFKRKKVSQRHCFQMVPDAKLKFGNHKKQQ